MTLPYTQFWLIWEPLPAPGIKYDPGGHVNRFLWGMPCLLEDPGPEIKDGVILDRVLHLYWIAADFTVFDIGLS